MKEYVNIPAPISFNPLKHHLNFIKSFLNSAAGEDIDHMISTINHNNVDLYTGEFSVKQICEFTIETLFTAGFHNRDEYLEWLEEGEKHRILDLYDGSRWVLLEGDQHNRYVHIHPAKTGNFTMRFKGSTLKTVYKLKKVLGNDLEGLPLDVVNNARKEIELSPIKRLIPGKGIMKCWEIL